MTGNKSAILYYHSLDTSGSVISMAPELFRQQMECLVERGIPVVQLSEVEKKPGSVALTFDDGFRNFVEHALPVLERYSLPATVFVVTGHCGGRNDWLQPYGGVPLLELMDWSELKQLVQSGVELGAHSVHHRDLSVLAEELVAQELNDCRRELEDRTGAAVTALCYPYGCSTPGVRRLVRQHYQLACGTTLQFVTPPTDPFDLPRIDAYYLRKPFWFKQVVCGDGETYLATRRILCRVRRIL
jgi:peptidoglycan/xylan/chitin deacetylase (PgdA/CDA1 family)